ncbi:hypothetical protein DAI22_09g055200 [Oryza sativa Japonica Group]|jgi:hypothetical protein|nr:hypothetical protein DAI22_09g055200 [Oryza sativa Japonica Group]
MTAAAMAPSPPKPVSPRQISLGDLRAVSMLGRSVKGVVFHVVPTMAGEVEGVVSSSMALKAISRETEQHKKMGSGGEDRHRRIWFEWDVLMSLSHPLLPSLRGVLATDVVVGLVIDRYGGRDLNSL